MSDFENNWALILGGSSGFGLASALKLSALGMNICVVHRDRRGSLAAIETEFNKIRGNGVEFVNYNIDALNTDAINTVVKGLKLRDAKIRTLLHSIAFGNLKLLAPCPRDQSSTAQVLADRLGIEAKRIAEAGEALVEAGDGRFSLLLDSPYYDNELLLQDEDLQQTIYAMGGSLLTWVGAVFNAEIFTRDARVIGLTSEGNSIAWRGYAAVSAAKAVLESASRSIAREYGHYGIRSNIIQAGVCPTRALRMIPGNEQLLARARQRNPLNRLTRPEDVANVVALLSMNEASWINGALIRVDGGEAISG